MAKADRAGAELETARAEAGAHKAVLDVAATTLAEVGVILGCRHGRDVRDRAREVMEELAQHEEVVSELQTARAELRERRAAAGIGLE